MISQKKKILISGGTGVLGRNLLRRLADNYEIVVLSRTSSGKDNLITNEQFLLNGHNLKFDLFIHAASDTRKNGALSDSVDSNIVLPLKIIQKIANPNLKIINVDTTFYESERNNYSLTKKQFSELLTLVPHAVMNFKIDNIYGGEENPNRFIPKILDDLFLNKESIQLTEGIQKRDFVHINDVVDILDIAVKKILVDFFEYRSFDIGSGKPVSVKEAVLKLKEKSGNTISNLYFGAIPYKIENEADLSSKVNITATCDFFGWKPRVDIDSGFSELVERKWKR